MTSSCRTHVDVDALLRMLGWSGGTTRKRLVSTEELTILAQLTGLSTRGAGKLLKLHRGDKAAALKAALAAPPSPEPALSPQNDMYSSNSSSEASSEKRVRFCL